MPKLNQQLPTIRTEGALLPPDILQRIASLKVDGIRPSDYHLPEGFRINEAVTQSWDILKKHWKNFQEARQNLAETEHGTALTNERWLLPLFKELEYGRLSTVPSPQIEDRSYPIERFYNHTPIHLIGCNLPLDRRTKGARGAATSSPHSMVQEFLNRSDTHLWGFLSNGRQLRILRDNVALSRQAYIEFDLEGMMDGEVYGDFVLLWLLAHQSRVEAEQSENCWLEQWSKLAREAGTRVLNNLRTGVTRAIEALGQGFISHPQNDDLRSKLQESASLTKDDFYRQLLRTVYRLLFLFVAEDRQLLQPPDADENACELYDRYYSTRRLREMAFKLRGSKHADLWYSLSLVFGALNRNQGQTELALPGLGSFLWNPASTSDLLGPGQVSAFGPSPPTALVPSPPDQGERARVRGFAAAADGNVKASVNPVLISNNDLLTAIRALAWVEQDKVLRDVDYRNLDTEEFGSVYESLLELHPVMHVEAKTFSLNTAAGNERKTSGSYYTPDSLVQCLLDSALEPVVEECLAEARRMAGGEWRMVETRYPKEFLNFVRQGLSQSPGLTAGPAHRESNLFAADQVAESRTAWTNPGNEGSERPTAIPEPMLAEMWQKTPFAIRYSQLAEHALLALKVCDPACGSGHFLIGAARRIARHLARIRTGESEPSPEDYQHALRDVISHCIYGVDINPMSVELCKVALWMEAMNTAPDGTLAEVAALQEQYARLVNSSDYESMRLLADTWCAAFVWKKDDSDLGKMCPTERDFRKVESHAGAGLLPHVRKEVERLRDQYQFFHWHLAFPDVFRLPVKDETPENEQTGWSGGFDVVLGNPPWVRQEMLKPIKQLLPKFKSYASTADSSVYFIELSVLTCRVLGRVAMLTPNKWFRANYAENLREVLRQRCRTELLIDFGHSRNLFPDADTFPAAVVFQPVGAPVPDSELARFVQAHDSDRERYTLPALISSHAVSVPHHNLRPVRWQLEDSGASCLLDRLVSTGRPLDSILNVPIIRGMLSGLNEAFYVESSQRNAMLAFAPGSEALFKKLLRGRDVKRWIAIWDDQWHIVIPSSHNRIWQWSSAADETEAEAIFAELHPSIHSHLKKFEQPLRARQDKGKYWWELRACDYYEEFEKPKILVQCIAYYSQFALDTQSHYVNNKVIVIPTDDLYMLAILNSRVTWWIVNRTFQHMKDEGLSVDVQFLRRLPVPSVSDALKLQVSELAHDLTTAAVSETGGNDIASLEVRLNELVMQAFALTDAERTILDATLPPRDPITTVTNQ